MTCIKCQSEYTYEDSGLLICPECGHEQSLFETEQIPDDSKITVKDINGVELKDGDTVTVIKDLKIKGSSSVVKVGTKVKNIQIVDGTLNAGHDINCKIPGFGQMGLKSEFVKKVT